MARTRTVSSNEARLPLAARTHTLRPLLLAALLAAPAAPLPVLAQAITPEQIVALKQVSAVALSPDGRQVAFTLSVPRGADERPGPRPSELWIVPAAGGEARAVVRAPGSASSPTWAPDGRTLAFSARLDPQPERSQVYAVPAEGGEPRRLTDSPTGVIAFAWAPDGRSLVYTAREPEAPEEARRREQGYDARVASAPERHVRLWQLALDGGTPRGAARPLTPADRSVRDFAWAPDGRTLAVQLTERADMDSDYMFRRIHTLTPASGALEPLARTEGKLGPMAWAPDGAHLAFLGATSLNDPLAQSVFVVPARGGEPINLTPSYEGSAVWVGWLDAHTVLFLAVEGTKTALNRVDAAGGSVHRMAGGGAEILQGVSVDAARRSFAAVANTPMHPNEVYAGSLRDGTLRRVTRHNRWLDGVRLARQETIEWSGADGWRIQGVLVRPLDERPGTRYPLAILPHGGPEGISTDGWTTSPLYPAQLLAAHGYAVLMPNYRGSGGRGVAFAKADHRDLGGKEFEDVLRGIDHLAASGLVDPERVGISGTSYGGYFSAWAATRHSERFKAAIPTAGISNWISFAGTTDIPYEMSLVHWDLWWFEHPGLSWDRSPLAHVNNARTPTLIVHGLADERVHPAQSMELYQALRLKGVPTDLVLYPREPHGLTERAHQIDFMNRVLEWLDRYVKGEATPSRTGSASLERSG